MMSGSVLVAKAGRWGWLLLLSGSQVQVGAARPLAAGGACRLTACLALPVHFLAGAPIGGGDLDGHWLTASIRNKPGNPT